MSTKTLDMSRSWGEYCSRCPRIRTFTIRRMHVEKQDPASEFMMDAAWAGNPQIIKLLMKKGSEVNATDAEGRTALQYAKLSKTEEIVELLTTHGAKE